MPDRSLKDRTKDRDEAEAKKIALFQQMAAKRLAAAASKPVAAAVPDVSPAAEPAGYTSAVDSQPTLPRQFVPPRLSPHEAEGTSLHLQPWSESLVKTLLYRASDKKLSLRLVWPAELKFLPYLHAVASLSRAFEYDLPGLRTLYYPGSNATRISLDRLAVNRSQLGTLRSELWSKDPHIANAKPSPSFEALLTACNDIYRYKSDEPPPQLRDLIPTFIFDRESCAWTSPQLLPLERQLRKVPKLARRRDLRLQIDADWRNSLTAPGALLVVPRNLKRKEWRALCAAGPAKVALKPDVLLLDASIQAMASDQSAVRRIPEFIQTVLEKLGQIGGLIVTDDPGIYFMLQRQLEKFDFEIDCAAMAAEAQAADTIVAVTPKTTDWKPEPRAVVNFSVSILDAEAAATALKFHKIAERVREDTPALENAFRDAQRFLQRASHLPGGFLDLQSADDEEQNYLQTQLQWLRVEDPIFEALRKGQLNEHRAQIAEAIEKAKSMINSCADGTPLAINLRDQIRRFAVKSSDGMTVLLPSRFDIAVAQRFLARTMGCEWDAVKSRVEWIRFVDAWGGLHARTDDRRLFLVGLSRAVARFVLTHEEIPRGTHLLVPVQRAIGMVHTLRGMMKLDAYRPYRARMGTLLAMLEQRLAGISNIEALSKNLASTSLSTKPALPINGEAADPNAHRVVLEDGRTIYLSGFVYRYDTAEGAGFARVQVRTLNPGDLIFEMSDALRDEIEEALGLRSDSGSVPTNPNQQVLALYHREVTERVATSFPAASRSACVRAIKARMLTLAAKKTEISESQIQYWVNLKADETTPHGARDHDHFLLFCRALNLDNSAAEVYWHYIRRARHSNQSYGRYLAGRYAEIVFQPESAEVYRKISGAVVERLRMKAMDCVLQVIAISDPTGDPSSEKEKR